MLDADAAQTAQVVEQASQANFVEFVLPALLRQTPQQAVSQWVQQAMQLAASDRIEDLPRVIAALDIRQLARRVFVQVEAAEDSERSLQGLVRASQSYASISEFLRSLLAHDYDAHADKWAGERIILSSIEAAKGLEFEHVIIPDLNRSDFDGERADERNLFYVAASRARRQLTLVHRPGQASSYLRHFVSN
jgi:DNA helicase-2/ATP-dependent DNA helicase PcrA